VAINTSKKKKSPGTVKPAIKTSGPLAVGDRIECNYKGKGRFYKGKIGEINGNQIYILYDDGDKERTTINMLKGYENYKAAAKKASATSAPSDSDSIEGLSVGTRVVANWKNKGKFYKGKVGEIKGKKVLILYDDGDREWASVQQIKGFENYGK
jgi:ribosomal protein L35AE/L33A